MMLVAVILQGCVAPILSDFQSARLVDEGAVELTPAGSYLPRLGQLNVGLQGALGVSPTVEARMRVAHAFVRPSGDEEERPGRLLGDPEQELTLVSVGLKLSLVEDAVALHLPVDTYILGAEVAPFVRPTLIASVPITEAIEVSPSVSALLPSAAVALNLGLGIGDLDRWAIRPEVGVLLNVPLLSLGVGFSYRLGAPATATE